jgi:hypothetical protein
MGDVLMDVELLSKKISSFVKSRSYDELGLVMKGIFQRDDKLQIVVELADRLPSSSLQDLFLSGITHITNLNDSDYKKMFELAAGRDIAIYNITRFLIIHGGARRSVLQRIVHNFDEIQRIQQFHAYLDNTAILESNEKKMNEHLYRTIKISESTILAFREKLNGKT